MCKIALFVSLAKLIAAMTTIQKIKICNKGLNKRVLEYSGDDPMANYLMKQSTSHLQREVSEL